MDGHQNRGPNRHESPVRRVRRSRRAVILALASGVALSLALGAGFASLSGTAEGKRATPATASGAPSPTPSRTTAGEAARLRALDPKDVARSVAAEDAAGTTATTGASVVKGVWKPGDVGTYFVGRGIEPGRYESQAPASGTCRWARLRGLGGKADEVVQTGSTNGPSVVTVRASDRFFQTAGCASWHKVG